MKFFLKMVKLVVASILIIVTQYSCDYILEKNWGKYEITSNAQTRIDIYKREAKLLLKASKNNLDILEICETLKQADTYNSVGYLTSTLEETHFEISENYGALAKDKLISVPRYTELENKEHAITNINYKAFIESSLKLILIKTETQIKLLDALGTITDNVDFKIMVIKDTMKLKSNIDKIEIALNGLNERIPESSKHKLLL